MGAPKGKIVVPLGFNPDGDLRSLELTAADALKVAFAAAAQGLVGPHGWIGGAWQKNPLLLGYSAQISELVTNLNAAAGDNTLQGSVVPAGEIWIVSAVHAKNVITNPAWIMLEIITAAGWFAIARQATPGSDVPVTVTGQFILSQGNRFQARFSGCALNDDLYFGYLGSRIDIDQ